MPKQSKSELLRAYLRKHPNSMPRDVVAKFADKGVTVTAPLVCQVKHNMKKAGEIDYVPTTGRAAQSAKRSPKATGSRKATRGLTRNVELDLTTLIELKELAARLGGIEATKTALESLEQIQLNGDQ